MMAGKCFCEDGPGGRAEGGLETGRGGCPLGLVPQRLRRNLWVWDVTCRRALLAAAALSPDTTAASSADGRLRVCRWDFRRSALLGSRWARLPSSPRAGGTHSLPCPIQGSPPFFGCLLPSPSKPATPGGVLLTSRHADLSPSHSCLFHYEGTLRLAALGPPGNPGSSWVQGQLIGRLIPSATLVRPSPRAR